MENMGGTFSRLKKSEPTSNISTSQPTRESTETNSSLSSGAEISDDSTSTTVIEFPSLPRETEFCFRGPVLRQNFSFSDKLMYYMAKNPSTAKLYQKMIQTCKYFFAVHPLIVVPCLKITKNGWKTCLINKLGHTKLDIDKIPSKLWLCGKLHDKRKCTEWNADEIPLESYSIDFVFSKLYRFKFSGRVSFGQQTIAFDQLLFYNGVKTLNLNGTIIIHENGSPVQLENIVANFPKLEEIDFTVNPNSSNISSTTVKELLKIPHFSQMKILILRGVPDIFDFETLFNYFKERDNLYCGLEFHSNISDEYFRRLEGTVDEMLATPEPTYFRFPWLKILNLDNDKQDKLMKRHRNDVARRVS